MAKKKLSGLFYNNFYWIGSFILSTIIISSLIISGYNTFLDRGDENLTRIPVIIESKKLANYADGVESFAFPGVELGIVSEVISDSQTVLNDDDGIDDRVANLVEGFQQSIPTATEFSSPTEEVENENSPIPTGTNTEFTATNTIIPVTGTSTFTQTAIFTPSGTYSPTWVFVTPTNSQTSTFLPTLTNTPTFSPTYTFTSTTTLMPTATSSMTITRTPSNTPTFTFTPTFTNSPTITPSWTIIPTFTFTSTSTRTPTLTFTPTYTSTFTPTFTRTSTMTFTPTYTSTFTPTFTRTPTMTFTPTFTSTFTPTHTSTPTSTITPTLPPTITPSPTMVFCNIDGKTVPLVKFMLPPDGSENVPVDIELQIIFDQAMDENTLVYGDELHVVICERINDSSNSCQAGTEVPARMKIKTSTYLNDTLLITPLDNLEYGLPYTLFAGNQISVHPDCRDYGKPVGGRTKSDFITIFE